MNMEKEIQIRCKNNKKTLNIRIGSTLSEIFRQSGAGVEYGPICARVNNKVEGMHYRVYQSKEIEFLGLRSPSALRTYTRTLFMVLCKAVNDLYPDGRVMIDIPVSNGYYCDLRIGRPVTDADADALRSRMKELIAAGLPIHRYETTTEEAVRMFSEAGATSKVKLLESTGHLYTIYYDLDGYRDYYYGALLTDTSGLTLFGLEKYYDGLLLRAPSAEDPSRLGELIRQDKMFDIFREHHRWQDILGLTAIGMTFLIMTGGHRPRLVNGADKRFGGPSGEEDRAHSRRDCLAAGREDGAHRRPVVERKDHDVQAHLRPTAGQRHPAR